MAEEEIRHPDGRIEHPQVKFEHSDASFKAVLGIILGAMALAALIHYVLLVFFHNYGAYEASIKKSPYPLAPAPDQTLPPEPRLEPLDRLQHVEESNVYLRQASREAVLNSYGETGEEGFVHIPIRQAIALLEEKKYAPKARPAPTAEQMRRSNGLVDSGESNSGRMFREKPRWYER